MTDLADLTLSAAGDALRRGLTTSRELTESILHRIEETEPRIHAYAHVYWEQSLTNAGERDWEVARGGWRGPLHGIPIAIKDLLYTTDAPTEAGSAALKGWIPPFTATVVEKLRAAGAIIVGKTVTHELAYGVNEPATRSPWGKNTYPGGSSAGSGAAVAARSAYGAIGTDTGGSIREPASLNGIVGLKPTFGRVSRYGVVPLSPSLDHVGPMTRTITDNALMLLAIAGFDRSDTGSIDVPVDDYLENIDRGIRGMRIGIERRYLTAPNLQPDVLNAVETVVTELRDAGAEIVDVSMPELDHVGTIGMTIMLSEAADEHRDLLRDRGDRLDPATRVMLELGHFVPATHYNVALAARVRFKSLVRELYSAHGLTALLNPTVPTTTTAMDGAAAANSNSVDSMTEAIDFTWPANVIGLPALTIPCGFSSDGLPIGVQLLGRPFAEASLYRLARAYERNHDWASRSPNPT